MKGKSVSNQFFSRGGVLNEKVQSAWSMRPSTFRGKEVCLLDYEGLR